MTLFRQRIVLVSLLLLIVPSVCLAQQKSLNNDRAIVRPRTVVLVRRGAIARQFPSRTRAKVRYPVISGLSDLTVLRRVQEMLQVKNIFETSLAEYKQDSWLEEFDYTVHYNQNHILDITFTQTGTAAYPDTHTKHFAIDLRDGTTIQASEVFASDKLSALAKLVDAKLQAELMKINKDNSGPGSDPEDARISGEAGEALEFNVENLNDLSVGAKGITFLYDAGYPHAIQAFEPEGQYFFSYAELKQFIKPDGLLGRFVK
ncbi:MAG TPA: hypothetical protein VGW36_01230 [Pyrinomonadaceae bacterium]|nr:hypothetical protein [Pyrinomonadaceae bacterium]